MIGLCRIFEYRERKLTLIDFIQSLGPTISNTMWLVGIYIILALGLNLINGMGGLFSIGHAGFWALGAYAAGMCIAKNPAGLPPWAIFPSAVILAILVTSLAGWILAKACLGLSGDYLAIATLGFSIIVVSLLYNFDYVGAATGLSMPTVVTGVGIWFFVLLAVIFYTRLQFSSRGRMILALREDEIAAQSIGIDAKSNKTLVFILGAAFAGVAGALYAGSANYLNPAGFEFHQSIKILTMVVLGGLGTITGVTLAAAGLTLLPELLRLFNFKEYEMLVFALVLLLMVLWRPQGIFGAREIWDLKIIRKYWHPDRQFFNLYKSKHPVSAQKKD